MARRQSANVAVSWLSRTTRNRNASASGDPILHGVIVTADDQTGRATGIERLSLSLDALETLAADLPDEKAAAGRG